MDRISLGKKGEVLAKEYLFDIGYEILEENYYSRYGEVDIIAKISDAYVFVEVKTRTNFAYGSPSEAVSYRKQKKLINTAYQYVQQNDIGDCELRFDIVEVFFSDNKYKINQIEDAFQTGN